MELLRANRVAEAYERAQAALRVLETVHHLLESARLRAMEAQRECNQRKQHLWIATGACVVLGLSCEFMGTMPCTCHRVRCSLTRLDDLTSSLSVLQETIATGAVLCFSMAAFVQLTSLDFSEYMGRFRAAQDARMRLRLRWAMNTFFSFILL
jgi:hypothetical protein